MVQQLINPESIATAIALAIIFAFVKLFRDVDHIKTTTEPLIEWWRKISLDSLKLATNPTSERLSWLSDKYIASVNGSGKITTQEKQELIDGLRELLNNPDSNKRQSASMALRFIETREGLTANKASQSNH